MQKEEKTIYQLVGIFLFVALIIGITYAYVTASLSGNEEDTSLTITSENGLTLIFTDGTDTLEAPGIAPGWSATKTFSVYNPTNLPWAYSIYFNEVNNTFVNTNDLVYTITSTNAGGNKTQTALPTTNTEVLSSINIPAGVTQEYTITVKYINSSSNQIADVGKHFSFEIFLAEQVGDQLKNVILANYGGRLSIVELPTSTFSSVEEGAGGLYKTEDDYGTSYYFRGNHNLPNNVLFGGYQWKIIRIDGAGNIRMIYNGECLSMACSDSEINGNEAGVSAALASGLSAFNVDNDDNAYIGYMYGTAGAGTYAATHANTNISTIKDIVDLWYNTLNVEAKAKIADVVFCMDRSMAPEGTPSENTALGYGNNITYYMAEERLNTNKIPTMECANANDKITLKIGLITADEVAFAGSVRSIDNYDYYLRSNQRYFTLTPYIFSGIRSQMFYVHERGFLSITNTSSPIGVRPVIALASSTIISSGDGSLATPFIIQ